MLKLIYNRINPSTRVGFRNLTVKLDQMNLQSFDQIVPDMIDDYEKTYSEILANQGSYLFDALATSTNKDFADNGETYSLQKLKQLANKKYNNLYEIYKRNNTTFCDKCKGSAGPAVSSPIPSSSQAKIMALATENAELKAKLENSHKSNNTNSQPSGKNMPSGTSPIASWRKKKDFGD